MALTPTDKTWSTRRKNTDEIATKMKTIIVVTIVSRRDGQVTFAISRRTCCTNSPGFVFAIYVLTFHLPFSFSGRRSEWQEWRDSNPQPPVLETGALPIELHS